MDFSVLVGKTLFDIEGLEKEGSTVIFNTVDGKSYKMYHEQDCCESVYIEDVIGDIQDIIGYPILYAEELIGDTPSNCKFEYEPESYTWTFYEIRTIKGSVTIRWYGESNGYYSESVSFEEIPSI